MSFSNCLDDYLTLMVSNLIFNMFNIKYLINEFCVNFHPLFLIV